MKHRTALQRSRASIRFLAVAVAVLAVLTFVYPSAYTVRHMKRRAEDDPTYLDKRL